MAQVKKYSKGDQISKVKLFNYEGVGDFNVDDLISAYANSINDELSKLNLGDKDRQKILDVTNDIMKNIQSGNIKGRNMSGYFLLPENSDLSSTGINEKKKFLGISTGKYKKDDDFYKNTSYALLDKIFKNVSTYTPKEKEKKDESTPTNYTLDFGKTIKDYYFNGEKFDPERWNYSNALNSIVARIDDEIKKVESGNYGNKDDVLSRLKDTRTALLDNDPSNDAIIGSRIGFDFRPLLNKDYDVKPKTEEEIKKEKEVAQVKEAQDIKDKIQAELENNKNSGDSYYFKSSIFPFDNNITDIENFILKNPINWASYNSSEPLNQLESNKIWSYLNSEVAQYLNDQGLKENDFYYIPESMNEEQGSIIRINPITSTIERVPISSFKKGAQKLLRDAELRYGLKKPWEYKDGGNVIKAQQGLDIESFDTWKRRKQYNKTKSSSISKPKSNQAEPVSKEKSNYDSSRKLSDGLEWDDYARLGAIASDLVALGTGLTGFTPASALAGVASTTANFAADMKDGFQWKDLGNAALNLGLDTVSLIPGLGAATQGSKVAKNLLKWGPRLLALWGAAEAYSPAVEAFNKLKDKGISSLTTNDIRALANGISAIASGTVGVRNQYKANQLLNKAKTGDVWVRTNKGDVKLTENQFNELKSKEGLQNQNKFLQDLVGNDKELLTKFGGSKWNPTRNWNNPSTRPDYNFGKTEVKETLKGPIEVPINYGRTNEFITKAAGLDQKKIYDKIDPVVTKVLTAVSKVPKTYNSIKYKKLISNKTQSSTPIDEEMSKNIESIVDNLGFVQKIGKDFNQQLALPQSSKRIRKINEEKIRKDSFKSGDSKIVPLNKENNFVRVGNGNLETPISGAAVRRTKKLQSKQLALPEKGTITTREQARQNMEDEINRWWGGTEGFDFYKYNNPYKVQTPTSISYTPNKVKNTSNTYYLFQNQVLKSLNKKSTDHIKREILPHKSSKKNMRKKNDNKGYVNKKQEGGIMKFKTPSGPITHIQAKDMSKWNRDNAISSYNMAKDIEDYLKSGANLDTYIAAFNGGEDLYDKMVGNTDYFSGKDIKYVEKNPLAYQRQVTFRDTNKGFDDLIRGSIIGHGVTEGNTGYDTYLGDRTYNRTLGRITADQANAFNTNQLNKYGIEFYLDPGSGHYRLRRTAIPTVNLPEVVVTPNNVTINSDVITTNPTTNSLGRYSTLDSNKDKGVKTPYFDNLLSAGRLAGTLYTNNKVAKTVSESLKPLVLTPNRIRRQVRGDLPTRNFYENQAAESNRLGSRPITSDANLQLAQQLMYNDRALKLKMQGFLADKEAIDKTSLLAQQANEQNQANAVDVANKNRASMLGIQQAKANIEASRRSANWQQAWNPYLSTLEQNYKNYYRQLDALNRDAANTVELRKLDIASKQAQNTLDLARTNWLKTNTGKSEYDWLNSDEYKNALNDYTEKVTNAGNTYKDTMSKYDLNNLRKPYSFLMFKSGGSTKDIAIENMKELNKTFRKNEELFHKIIMDSKKENNKLIMNLSSLTKELIIKSMTM